MTERPEAWWKDKDIKEWYDEKKKALGKEAREKFEKKWGKEKKSSKKK